MLLVRLQPEVLGSQIEHSAVPLRHYDHLGIISEMISGYLGGV